ncbi:hypothetical protein [Sphingomonas sp. RS2018]
MMVALPLLPARSVAADARMPAVMVVPARAGYAWWAREPVFKPASTAIGPITLAQIDAVIAAKSPAGRAMRICQVDLLRAGAIASADRQTQREIDATLAKHPSAFAQPFRSGPFFFVVRVVVYRTCGIGQTGTALLITDRDGALAGFEMQDFAFTWLYLRDDGGLNVLACFECGDISELGYDSDRRRFYQTWIGH